MTALARELDAFLAHLRDVRDVSPHTLRAYAGDLRAFLASLPAGAGVPGRVELRRWLVELSEQRLEATSIRRKLSSIRAFFRFLRERRGLDHDPGRLVRGPRLPRRVPRRALLRLHRSS